jgi:hypothetical protein
MSKKDKSLFNEERLTIIEKEDFFFGDGFTLVEITEVLSKYPPDAKLIMEQYYEDTDFYITWERKENLEEYTLRYEKYKKDLERAAKAAATKAEKARIAAVKKEEQERELFNILKEKYGEK